MNSDILLNIFLAVIPGTIWLLYFLRKDVMPEPTRQILKIFILGFLVSIPTAFFELWMLKGLMLLSLSEIVFLLVKFILIIGLVEEMFKYFVVRFGILNSSHIDEPVDIPLYMIISALGFATAENLFVFFSQGSSLLSDHLLLSLSRFIGATLLHALCSGIIGYFLALSFCQKKFRHTITFFGFSLAIILHGLFDFFLESSIMKATENDWGSSALYSIFILIVLFILLSIGFKQIKKLKGVCKI